MNGDGTGIISRLSRFIQQPFSAEMDLWNWVLLAVVLVTVAILWTRILAHITEG
jgi:hypothetical protein